MKGGKLSFTVCSGDCHICAIADREDDSAGAVSLHANSLGKADCPGIWNKLLNAWKSVGSASDLADIHRFVGTVPPSGATAARLVSGIPPDCAKGTS